MTTPYVELKDKHGNNICFGHCGDILIPAFPTIPDFRQHARDIREMTLKPDDVIIASFPKTGTNWHCEIVKMLMGGTSEYAKSSGIGDFLDLTPVEKVNNTLDSPPRIFFTHLKFHQLPRQVVEKKVKVIYLERNPKDAWVSLFNHTNGHKGSLGYDGTWDQFFDLMISFGYWYGDWFDYVLEWERVMQTQTDVPIFTSVYEDLKKDPVGQIEKLAQFLGYNRSREMCEQIADACSFSKLKTAKVGLGPLFKEGATGLYRKGEIGDWKNWFTVAQDELFDDVYSKRMVGSKLSYTFVQ